jgi:ketosteroid isomerase-like protein
MDRADVDRWIAGYLIAWESNAPADIEALFTEDAEYLPGPFDEAWKGLPTIVASWIDRKDEPGDTRFSYDILAVDGNLAIVEGTTDYLADDYRFANIWLIELAEDGRARRFTEYWVQAPKQDKP